MEGEAVKISYMTSHVHQYRLSYKTLCDVTNETAGVDSRGVRRGRGFCARALLCLWLARPRPPRSSPSPPTPSPLLLLPSLQSPRPALPSSLPPADPSRFSTRPAFQRRPMSLSLPSAGRPQENATASGSSAAPTPAFNPALNLPLSAPTPAPMGAPTPAPTPGGSGQLLSVPE